jgi:hypothetical protein
MTAIGWGQEKPVANNRKEASMKRFFIPSILLIFLVMIPAGASFAKPEIFYVPDHPGKAHMQVGKDWDSIWRLSKTEAAAWHKSLQTIIDIIQSQQRLKYPVKGVDVQGWLRAWKSSVCGEKYCPGLIVDGQGYIYYHLFFRDASGKIGPGIEPSGSSSFFINDIEAFLAPVQGMKDAKGAQICMEPRVSGEIQGFPLYRIGVADVLVLTKRTAKLWIPLTREEFLKSDIKEQAEEIARVAPASTPSDTYKKWLTEKPKRQKELREIYTGMKKVNPEMAEEFLMKSEKMEADMSEFYRKESQKTVQSLFKPGLSPADRLERHRQVLRDMSPEERKMQARYLKDDSDPLAPYLAPAGSSEGAPLVVQNPGFFDKKLARTAIQIFAVTFPEAEYFSAEIDNPDSPSFGLPSLILQRYVLKETEWRAIYEKVIK